MDLISVDVAAERLNLSKTRILSFLNENRLKGTKISGVWVIRENDLREFQRDFSNRRIGRPRKEKIS